MNPVYWIHLLVHCVFIYWAIVLLLLNLLCIHLTAHFINILIDGAINNMLGMI